MRSLALFLLCASCQLPAPPASRAIPPPPTADAAALSGEHVQPTSEAPAPPVGAKITTRMPTSWNGDDSEPLAERGKLAMQRRRAVVEQLFDDADVTFPPAELLLRAFKAEKELEVWAASERGGAMKRVATYGICRISGDIGPKRREGDLQVPEGFYRLDYFWPDASFWLSAKVSYPNALDKQLGGGAPGGDIMIHGDCASIGCISLSDERMEELWVMGTSLTGPGAAVNVHIFPTRELAKLTETDSPHRAFWDDLRLAHESFERDRRLPNVGVGFKGRYELRD